MSKFFDLRELLELINLLSKKGSVLSLLWHRGQLRNLRQNTLRSVSWVDSSKTWRLNVFNTLLFTHDETHRFKHHYDNVSLSFDYFKVLWKVDFYETLLSVQELFWTYRWRLSSSVTRTISFLSYHRYGLSFNFPTGFGIRPSEVNMSNPLNRN